MEIKINDYSNHSSLISSIISLCIGGLLFTKAEEVLDIIAVGLGIIIAVIGLVNIILYARENSKGSENRTYLMIGILLVIVSVIFILCHDVVENVIRYIIGGYILFTGIIRLMTAIGLGFKDKRAISVTIVSIALILIGVYTIITENVILSTVGLIMIIYSIVEIIGFIFYKKNETKSTSVIIEEIIEDKEPEQDIKAIKTTKEEKIKRKGKIKEAKTSNEKNKKKTKKDDELK